MAGTFITLLLSSPHHALGQTAPVQLHCGSGLRDSTAIANICLGEIASTAASQHFEIHLQLKDSTGGGVPGAVVRLRPTSGLIVGDSTISAGPNGDIKAMWIRNGGSEPVGIAVHALAPAGDSARFSAVRYLQLSPKQRIKTNLVLKRAQFTTAGYEGSNLSSRALIAEIREQQDTGTVPIAVDSICRKQRVVFRPSGGTVTPDTARPTVYPVREKGKSRPGCFAEATWALGSGLGSRILRFGVVPAEGFDFPSRNDTVALKVRVRPLPRFILGAGLRWDLNPYAGIPAGTKVYRVERTTSTGKIVFDSIPGGAVDDKITSWNAVMAGVSLPVVSAWPRTNWVTVLAGVDIISPKRAQYLGFSVLRPFRVLDGFPFDIGLVAHGGVRPELTRPDDCRVGTSSIKDRDPCETDEDWELIGAGLVFTVDAGTILVEALKKLGG